MAHAVLYTRSTCSFCDRAKALLDAHGIAWTERSLDRDRELAARLAERFGGVAMPYILLDGEPVAGLAALEKELAAR